MKDLCEEGRKTYDRQELLRNDPVVEERTGDSPAHQSDSGCSAAQDNSTSHITYNLSHSSRDNEPFIRNCTTNSVLDQRLEAVFHLCRVEEKASSRKRSLRTRSSGSTSGERNKGSLSQKSSSDSLSSVDSALEDDVYAENGCSCLPRLTHCNKSICVNTRSESMGCVSSKSVVVRQSATSRDESWLDDDSDDNKQTAPGDNDVGLKTASKADLLQTQRLAATDVSPGLEKRWLRSHFSGQSTKDLSKNAGGKRRKGGKKTVSNSDLEASTKGSREGMVPPQPLPPGVRKRLSILHFNDVYEISERNKEPVGGAARFATAIKQQAARIERETGDRPLIIFGGDCLNPSTLSCATQGEHMIEVLNSLQVDVAVFGNHEFDFGAEHAVKCIKKMKSTWLLSNVVDQLTGKNLVEGVTKHVVDHAGLKIGFLGLVEEEWLDTLATIDKSHLDFQDYVEKGREIAAQLREEGADFVIALTHMRWPNDDRLARLVPDIDLVLGGHDHEYGVKEIDECLVIKSGSDFRNFSSVDVFVRDDGCVDVKLVRYDVTKHLAEDREMAEIVRRYMSALERSLDISIGEIKADLDGRFMSVRTRETALGNLVADIMATVTRADIVLINSGTFRSDDVHKRGDFRLDDLMKILPISDTVVTIEVTGQQLLLALENGVSKLPKREGRFPQISNFCFGYDPNAEPGRRVVAETVLVRGKPLDMQRVYTMATKAYVARGKDGYDSLKQCKIRTDPDSGPLLSTVVRNHIKNVFRLLQFEKDNSCQITISEDGKILSSNEDANPHQALIETGPGEIDEAPLDHIKRSMGMIKDSNNNLDTLKADTQKVHTPNFITYTSSDQEDSSPTARKVATLRQAALTRESRKLLQERESSPHDLKWQVLPFIEGRIFHCKSIDD